MNGCRFELVLASGILVIAAALSVLVRLRAEEAGGDVIAAGKTSRTDWMFKAKVGMSTHYAGSRANLEKMAGQFQAEKVAEQAAEAGVGWFLFTLHHQPWAMMAPNSAYDQIVGSSDYTAERDVPMALIKALTPKGVKLMLYVNLRLDPRSACPANVRTAMGGWPPHDELIDNVATVYREFSMRYGDKVVGWWVDGVWMSEFKKSRHREKWFATIAQALRAGNPNAIVAFNPGTIERFGMIRYSKQNDYTAGETNELRFVPKNRWIDGAQCHVWTFLGKWWSASGVRFDDRKISNYAKRVTAGGGVLTFEVGTMGKKADLKAMLLGKADHKVKADSDPNSSLGMIDPRQVEQVRLVVKAIREAAKGMRGQTDSRQ